MLTYKFPHLYEITFNLPPFLIWRKKSLKTLATFLESLEQPPNAILDIGCGTGIIVPILQRFFKNAKIVGIDISTEMIELAQKLYGNIAEFKIEDFFEHRGKYNLIILFHNFYFFQLENALNKINQLLKENGTAVIVTRGPSLFSYLHRFVSLKILKTNEYLYKPSDFQKIVAETFGFPCKWKLIDIIEGSYILIFTK